MAHLPFKCKTYRRYGFALVPVCEVGGVWRRRYTQELRRAAAAEMLAEREEEGRRLETEAQRFETEELPATVFNVSDDEAPRRR